MTKKGYDFARHFFVNERKKYWLIWALFYKIMFSVKLSNDFCILKISGVISVLFYLFHKSKTNKLVLFNKFYIYFNISQPIEHFQPKASSEYRVLALHQRIYLGTINSCPVSMFLSCPFSFMYIALESCI